MYVCPGSNDESIVAYNKKRKVKKKKDGGRGGEMADVGEYRRR